MSRLILPPAPEEVEEDDVDSPGPQPIARSPNESASSTMESGLMTTNRDARSIRGDEARQGSPRRAPSHRRKSEPRFDLEAGSTSPASLAPSADGAVATPHDKEVDSMSAEYAQARDVESLILERSPVPREIPCCHREIGAIARSSGSLGSRPAGRSSEKDEPGFGLPRSVLLRGVQAPPSGWMGGLSRPSDTCRARVMSARRYTRLAQLRRSRRFPRTRTLDRGDGTKGAVGSARQRG
jgi:hypothetical protein